jgi:hypothetical protein
VAKFSDWNQIRVTGDITGTARQEALGETIKTSGHADTLTAGSHFTVGSTHYTFIENATAGSTSGFLATDGTHQVYFTQDTPPTHTSVTADPNPTGTGSFLLCFMAGTRIATPGGEVAVEALEPGDLVVTSAGAAVPVRWIGRQTVSRHFADPERSLPMRIKAGALGGGLPRCDLLLSPGHAVCVDGMLVNAAALVNGTSIVRERDVAETFTYYHVELAEHLLLLAEGALAESFVDNAARENFDNWVERDGIETAAPIVEMDLPRVYAARQVPVATRRRLAAVAAQLGYLAVAAA